MKKSPHRLVRDGDAKGTGNLLVAHGTRSVSMLVACVIVCGGGLIATGCGGYRVEHHKRSPFYQQAANNTLADEFVDEDGTVVKYESTLEQSTFGRKGDEARTPLLIREESEDRKTVTLRNFIPEHVLANTMTCLRNEEYQVIYEQLLAQATRENYETADGGGLEAFAAFFRKHRTELAATLNRMMMGMPMQQTDVRTLPDGRIRCSLRPQIGEGFHFTKVEMIEEGPQLKLLMIK